MTTKKHNKHDKFFRKTMEHPLVAREFLQSHLPAEIVKRIDWSYLKLQPRSFVTDIGGDLAADLVFRTKIVNQDAYLCLLVEHQSTPDELMSFRILHYICQIISRHLDKTGTKKIPLFYPVVVYHGKKPYPYSTDIRDLVDAPRQLIDQFFLKPFQLIDLNTIDDEVLKNKVWAGVMSMAMKHIYALDILEHLPDIITLVTKVDAMGGHKMSAIVLEYVATARGLANEKSDIIDIICEKLPEVGENIMGIVDRWEAKGEARGEARGEVKGEARGKIKGEFEARKQIARNILVKTKDRELAEELTGLTSQ